MSFTLDPSDPTGLQFGNVPGGATRAALLRIAVANNGGANENYTIAIHFSITGTAVVMSVLGTDGWSGSGADYQRSLAVDSHQTKTVQAIILMYANTTGSASTVSVSGGIDVTVTGSAGPASTTVHFRGKRVNAAPLMVDFLIDRSANMAEAFGADTKLDRILHAGEMILGFLTPNDWVGVLAFNETVSRIVPLEQYTSGSPTRTNINNLFMGGTVPGGGALTATGRAAIGRSVRSGRNEFSKACSCAPPKSRRAFVILTDGNEDPTLTPKVASLPSSTETCHVIGVGDSFTAAQLTTLSQLVSSGGGTTGGLLSLPSAFDSDGTTDYFEFEKFVLQLLGNLSGTPQAFDPYGTVSGDERWQVRMPISAADSHVRVIALTDRPDLLDAELIPWNSRQRVEPNVTPGVCGRRGRRFVELAVDRTRLENHTKCSSVGAWSLEIALNQKARACGDAGEVVRFSVVGFVRSDVEFRADLHQSGYEVGAVAFINAMLLQYGASLSAENAKVVAEIRFPDGGQSELLLQEAFPGRFQTDLLLRQPGLYRIRLRAIGTTYEDGSTFHREQTLTAYAHAAKPSDCCAPAGLPQRS